MTTRPPNIGVVDYQMGNLRSVEWALEALGANPRWVTQPDHVSGCDGLVLPGVGAFPQGMQELNDMGMVPLLRDWVSAGQPLMGICLGFQLLFDYSEEGDGADGLGVVPGIVRRLAGQTPDGLGLKVPHMGWSEVKATADSARLRPFSGRWFYFVHSFAAPADIDGDTLETEYGERFTSALVYERTWGCQFHPERSGRGGLALLSAFLETVR